MIELSMEVDYMWIVTAILSAIFAGITAILAKCGIKKTDTDIATAIRTVIVLIFSVLMTFIVGSYNEICEISTKTLVFLILSGIATGASWICYFKALSIGDINKVVAIDKSSTVISVLLAIIVLQETNNLIIKLIGSTLLAIGIFLMIEKKNPNNTEQNRIWIIYAFLSAVFAAATSILAKIGIDDVESNLGTTIRTFIVLIFAWAIVFAKGKQEKLKTLDKKELFFISLSGVATGASWLCYYYAIQNGIVSVVVPIDRLSIIFSIAFSYIVFKEKQSKKIIFGSLPYGNRHACYGSFLLNHINNVL